MLSLARQVELPNQFVIAERLRTVWLHLVVLKHLGQCKAFENHWVKWSAGIDVSAESGCVSEHACASFLMLPASRIRKQMQ
jgi:hypothetical protein